MGFANKWLRYLESQEGKIIYGVEVEGKRPEDMPFTDINVNGEKVKQTLKHRKGMRIPNQIAIKPVPVSSVAIETSEGLTFYISRGRKGTNDNMVIRYSEAQEKRSSEKEAELISEARKRGYDVVAVMPTSA